MNHQARASICSVPLTAFGKNALFTISIYIYILQTDSLRYGTVEKSGLALPAKKLRHTSCLWESKQTLASKKMANRQSFNQEADDRQPTCQYIDL